MLRATLIRNSKFEIRNSKSEASGVNVPKKVIKKIGKLVPEDKKTASGTKVQDSGERAALPDGLTNVDPTSVTEEEVKILLERSAKKQYKDSTYVPVRVNTPQILIEVAQSYGEKIDNLPVVMQVEKVRQAMSTQEQWQSEGKTSRAHELSSGDIISIIKAMNTPKYIVYQTNNDRYVEIVKYKSSNNTEAVAIIEIGEHKNPQYLNGYKGGEYQVLITTFNPDENTIESILNNSSNRVLYPKKKKGSSQRGSGNNVPSHLNDSPFAISISQKSQNSNTSDKNSSKDFDSGERSALADGKRATAGEVAAVKSSISKKGIDPKGIIAIADKYFARYSGQLTRTGVRYEFLAAADMLFDLTAESGDRAYASVEALAEELVTNEKDKKPPIVSLYYKRSFLFDCGF